ncbi:YbjN domain-containing protein [Synechococcus sp. PCC 7335]|uniref:YbjN domain-containing protein n=1 Tax=Synechococcus sp. (strain ATCC 29403 / PCC 7335) TaxID=91464 RepID=UPI00056F567C|nr:YbjN domain-containing protein [Synechococcus sp. PCC 7335]
MTTTPAIETLAALPDNSEEEATSPLDVIETVISSLEQEGTAMVNHSDDGHLWKFKYGSVDVFVQLSGETDEDTLTVWSPVHKLPVQNEADMMRKLLEMNCGNTFEACFGLLEDSVVVFSARTLMDINPSEISRLMTIVASIADENDEELLKNYPAA